MHHSCGAVGRFLVDGTPARISWPLPERWPMFADNALCVSGVRRRNERKASNRVFGTSTNQSMKFNVETLRLIPFFCGRTNGVSPVSFESHGRRNGMLNRVANQRRSALQPLACV